KVKPLKEVVKISNEKIDPTKDPYRTKNFRYVSIAKISESGEIFEWEEFYGWQAPSRARMVIRKGDILVPSLSGTFDKIALVPEELDNQLTTTGCFVVRAVKDYPEFLFLLFRSPLVKRQLERLTTGAIMSAVPKKVFGDLLIPDIPKERQQEIVTLIKEYFELRKEARHLIQKAIREVEGAIENASRSNRE
ncbi:MAG TPA: restriction endonuclease subunit S, partial [Aquifex aeolicus]|nr:restriction endonuclease subunit S [Aquifex aeolicus]